MSYQKERTIKKYKKNKIWPYIASLILFVIFFVIAVVGFLMLFVSFLFVEEVQDKNIMGEKLQKAIEAKLQENGKNSFNANMMPYVINDEKVCIYDADNELRYKNGTEGPNLDSVIELVIDDERGVFFDKNDSDMIEQSFLKVLPDGTLDISIKKIFTDYLLGDSDGDSYLQEGWKRQIVIDVPVWFRYSINDGKYVMYVSSDLVITNQQMVYTIFIIFFSIFISIVPLIMFISAVVGGFKNQRRMTKVLYYDQITGKNNWMYFREQAAKLLKKRKYASKKFALICVKTEKYQSYCTCYGHNDGEELLENVATILTKIAGKGEVAARHGGSDFAALLQYDVEEDFNTRIEDIITNLKQAGGGRKIDFNLGIFGIIDRKADVDAIYGWANIAAGLGNDETLSEAIWFKEEMRNDQLWTRYVEDNMERALARREFQVYIQPKYNASTHKLGGGEALIRWISPTEGFIGPGRFIPIFEKNGFITKIDDFMLTEVSKLQAGWISQGKTVVPISVNVSRAHFAMENLAEHIRSIVDGAGAPRDCIELELTESAFFDDKATLLKTVKELKELGFVISMDDFGAGYSSLNSLKDLPLDVVKLDAEFFRGDEEVEKRGEIVVKEAINLAKNLDMRIVAEGIETKEQVEFLAEQGCDLIQGFYFAKPMTVSDYEERAFSNTNITIS